MSRSNVRPAIPQGWSNASQQNAESLRQQARQFLRERNRPQVSTHGLVQQKPSQAALSLQKQAGNNRIKAQNVASHIKQNHPQYQNWFSESAFTNHHFQPQYWHDHVNWWLGAPWNRLYGWLGWGGIYPIYYDAGIYPTQINVDADQYNQQNIANQNAQADEGEWLPLGVYALATDAAQAGYSNIFIQLAINQQGDIAGTYYNASTDKYYPIEGAVNQESQQAYWRVTEGTFAPAMTTGIYNLTQDVVDVQLTFPGGDVQNWILVRIAA